MKLPKSLIATLKLVPRLQIFHHILSRLVTPYHTLSPTLERKPFSFGNSEISSQAPDLLSHLITPCHSLSHLITSCPLSWKQNHLMLTTLKLFPRLQIFYHILSLLVTPYHVLFLRLERKPFSLGKIKISSQAPDFLSHLITPSHSLSRLITPYPLRRKENY